MLWPRAIAHVDMDAFFASVEQRDRPELRGKPVVVGGDGRRGVVAAASYEARRYGIHSAMPSARARQRCPELIFVRPRMARYREVSKQVFALFATITPVIEPLSVDEAFLDLTASQQAMGPLPRVIASLRERIKKETALTASVGLAPNKFVAKVASDVNKPDGVTIVTAAQVADFLAPLPVKRIWGVGPKAAAALQQLGIHSIADLRGAHPDQLRCVSGHRADRLLELAWGRDDRPVATTHKRKSISAENTFSEDLQTWPEIAANLSQLATKVAGLLRSKNRQAGVVKVKLRTKDFRTFSRQRTIVPATDNTQQISQCAMALTKAWWEQSDRPPVRLLGVGTGDLQRPQTADLFTPPKTPDRVADRVQAMGVALHSARSLAARPLRDHTFGPEDADD